MQRTCAYCGFVGTKKDLTRDHIPPKGVFHPSVRDELITVPSCKLCHSGTAKDDDYFRTFLGLSEDVKNLPAGEKLSESVVRSLERPESDGYRRYIHARLEKKAFLSPGGIIYFVNVHRIDTPRVGRVLERIVRGLHYHTLGTVVPNTHNVIVMPADRSG